MSRLLEQGLALAVECRVLLDDARLHRLKRYIRFLRGGGCLASGLSDLVGFSLFGSGSVVLELLRPLASQENVSSALDSVARFYNQQVKLRGLPGPRAPAEERTEEVLLFLKQILLAPAGVFNVASLSVGFYQSLSQDELKLLKSWLPRRKCRFLEVTQAQAQALSLELDQTLSSTAKQTESQAAQASPRQSRKHETRAAPPQQPERERRVNKSTQNQAKDTREASLHSILSSMDTGGENNETKARATASSLPRPKDESFAKVETTGHETSRIQRHGATFENPLKSVSENRRGEPLAQKKKNSTTAAPDVAGVGQPLSDLSFETKFVQALESVHRIKFVTVLRSSSSSTSESGHQSVEIGGNNPQDNLGLSQASANTKQLAFSFLSPVKSDKQLQPSAVLYQEVSCAPMVAEGLAHQDTNEEKSLSSPEVAEELSSFESEREYEPFQDQQSQPLLADGKSSLYQDDMAANDLLLWNRKNQSLPHCLPAVIDVLLPRQSPKKLKCQRLSYCNLTQAKLHLLLDIQELKQRRARLLKARQMCCFQMAGSFRAQREDASEQI